jgi:hypothetical protein
MEFLSGKPGKTSGFKYFFGIVCKIWFATRFLLATPMKHIVQVLEIITSGTTWEKTGVLGILSSYCSHYCTSDDTIGWSASRNIDKTVGKGSWVNRVGTSDIEMSGFPGSWERNSSRVSKVPETLPEFLFLEIWRGTTGTWKVRNGFRS